MFAASLGLIQVLHQAFHHLTAGSVVVAHLRDVQDCCLHSLLHLQLNPDHLLLQIEQLLLQLLVLRLEDRQLLP